MLHVLECICINACANAYSILSSHAQSIQQRQQSQVLSTNLVYNYIYIYNPSNSISFHSHLSLARIILHRHQEVKSEATMRVVLITVAIFCALVSTTVDSCSPSDLAALKAVKASLTESHLGLFNSWTGTDCCVNWYGVSCNPATRRIVDINLRGESEDPILSKSGQSGFMSGSIAPEICNLDSLTTLVLADWKGITGEIPQCLTSLSSLRVLDLIGNQISGGIPADIGNLKMLRVLNLADNKITGEIPASFVNLAGLMHLDLSNNKISGKIPAGFSKLGMLSRALLSRNQLTGSIPESIGNMPRLADLDLSRNQISGWIPDRLGKMKVLSTLNLDSNLISGALPWSLLSNRGLGILNLSRNSIEGNIPDVFHADSYFMALDLSFNKLKGPIPGSLSSAKYIGHLDLSHNHLCGNIPVGNPFDHLEASSFANNDCLCGNPLKTC